MSPAVDARGEHRPGVEFPAADTSAPNPPRPETDEILSLLHNDDGLAAPALPTKSAFHVSRLLSPLPQKSSPDERHFHHHGTPHQGYLSEEDTSSSEDVFSDCDEPDSDSERAEKSISTRASHEDAARIVTFVFIGRPSIVELPPRLLTSGSTGPASFASSRRPSTGIVHAPTEPTVLRTRSISSTFTSPQRDRSRILETRGPTFLTIDPFAAKAAEPGEPESPRATPKKLTGMLRKTLSVVKKRSHPRAEPRRNEPPPRNITREDRSIASCHTVPRDKGPT